ncbi:hypothetical protein PHMEG_00020488 [Phytophthora megakarya]|uniref:Uncharacterized protein n=1 Tax=Phytophthora megakarya TaxID=4795 RepID=A0A225VQT2_9STRA|nr:hypothetical protein PHMEG_00020488 [Phytophthora megakarya]
MESVGTPDLDSWEYDPDDLGILSSSGHNSGRAAVATATIGAGNSSSLIQRVRISAISDLKELNVAALRAKLKIKDGNTKASREHVDHYVETLGDPELADSLTLLRLADVDELEEVLRARERAKRRQRRSAFGSKFRQKSPTSAPTAPVRVAIRAIQMYDPSSESEGDSGSDGSDSEGGLRRIFLAAAEEIQYWGRLAKLRSNTIPNESV